MGDVLDQLLTLILKGHAIAMAKVIVDAPGNANLATLDQPLEPSSDAYAVAENIVVLDHDVADIDANPEAHPPTSGSPSFDFRSAAWISDRTVHGINNTREFGEYAVANGVGNPTSMTGDELVNNSATDG